MQLLTTFVTSLVNSKGPDLHANKCTPSGMLSQDLNFSSISGHKFLKFREYESQSIVNAFQCKHCKLGVYHYGIIHTLNLQCRMFNFHIPVTTSATSSNIQHRPNNGGIFRLAR